MIKRLAAISSIFVIGYVSGTGSVPKGLETLLFVLFAYISGAFHLKLFLSLRSKIRKSSYKLQFFGYEIRKATPVSPLAVVESPVQQSECDFCNGDEVRINNQRIPCPKCKNDKKRKRSV